MQLDRREWESRKDLEDDFNHAFVDFLENFIKNDKRVYRLKVENLIQKQQRLLVILYGDLMGHSTYLWDMIVTRFGQY